ncbi:hypothetical protein [Flavobacterium sp.]|uniref:hypothetical protein n=1 Tax=Flavobacterium sp. TaxID=239 RepID=UPI00286E3123|nr:hypothetical protein [Flavobacterium sp.]
MIRNIYCQDASLAAMFAKQKKNGTWDIFRISEIFGMGSADYKIKVFDFEISNLVILNSTIGISYVCVKKDQNWCLLEIKANGTIECEWKMISEFTFPTVDKMLSDYKINQLDFNS